MNNFKQAVFINIFLAGVFSLASCSNQTLATPPQSAKQIKPCVGCDADEHGCRASAGYSWCATENSCVRVWELERAKGINLGGDNFQAYCNGKK